MVKPFDPDSLPAPLGMYSHVAASGELVFLAGQLSVDESGDVVGSGDLAAQMRLVFEYIGRGLSAAGCEFTDVVAMTTYLTDRSSIAPFFECRREIFPELFGDGPYPPNTLLIVNGLVLEACLIEVQVVAEGGSGT